jgi:hypothetical protein
VAAPRRTATWVGCVAVWARRIAASVGQSRRCISWRVASVRGRVIASLRGRVASVRGRRRDALTACICESVASLRGRIARRHLYASPVAASLPRLQWVVLLVVS